jgi:adenine-specific DNA methylase
MLSKWLAFQERNPSDYKFAVTDVTELSTPDNEALNHLAHKLVLAHTSPQPEKREELLELIERITLWKAVKDSNSENLGEARELILNQYDRPPCVPDLFAGGGSIPLEALRPGCETYASDCDPVTVLIEKATLKWPQKFGIGVEMPYHWGTVRPAFRGARHAAAGITGELRREQEGRPGQSRGP